MPGLVPGIHVLHHFGQKDVDGRDKPGHDENSSPLFKGRWKTSNLDNCLVDFRV